MIIQILSDLHLEHHPDHGRELVESMDFSGADIVILAGDIAGIGERALFALPRLQQLCEKAPGQVLYVPGNHEYYGANPTFVEHMLQRLEAEMSNFRVLRTGKLFEQDGLRFLGDTLWFPEDSENWRFSQLMSDFLVIREFTPWVYHQNTAFIQWLERELRPGDIVITHHLPSDQIIAPRYIGNVLNRFFVSDLTNLILERKPALWVCGHTHTSIDTMLGTTRIVCNPRGYPNEGQTAKFNPRLLIQINGG
jgi:predicted phosphodiesterase